MTREEVKEILPILQAYANGKTILYDDCSEGITDLAIGNFERNAKYYHIKPESTYRPFASAQECIEEMKKHEPFGWVKEKYGGECAAIQGVSCSGDKDFIKYEDSWVTPNSIFQDVIFPDGTPFGVKVEDGEE